MKELTIKSYQSSTLIVQELADAGVTEVDVIALLEHGVIKSVKNGVLKFLVLVSLKLWLL